nr:integrase, catalytic region, zinc finger, CCHC-type, peptidase aspartic, catalytic [Tanacetum cinerariifolium]
MANLSEDIQCAGSDTRPSMLDRTDFVSWQQRIRLYCQCKENGVNILKSIDEGPFQMGTVRETLAEGTKGTPHLGPVRPRVYSDLSPEEKDRYNDDIRATNILLQGLPKYIYTLINHYTNPKDIWDNVKMLLEGFELTKEDRESQLGLRDFNYDQLYAYLKQHDAHANENKMMLDRFIQRTVDPLALMSNVSHQEPYSQSSTTPPSIYVPPHLADNAHLNPGQGNNLRGRGAAGYEGAHNRVGNANPGQARQIKCYNCNCIGHIARKCTQPKRPQNSNYFKDKMLLMQAQENEVALDEEQLLFLADDCDAFDSNVDEASMAQTMFMANLSSADPVYDEADPSYDSDILSKYVKDNAVPGVQSHVSSVPNDVYMMIYNDMYEPYSQSVSKTSRNTVVENSLTAEHATYKEQVELYERRARFELTERE